jgi:hypothetical protein
VWIRLLSHLLIAFAIFHIVKPAAAPALRHRSQMTSSLELRGGNEGSKIKTHWEVGTQEGSHFTFLSGSIKFNNSFESSLIRHLVMAFMMVDLAQPHSQK